MVKPCGIGFPQGYKKPNDRINAQMVNGQMVNDLFFDIFGLRLGFAKADA
ncbi:MAG: hypothetical protein IJV28_04930 [Paludibacteraceae bacterium]|nr:hypothetical protein [Paludibacteraceae bacterium]